MRTAKSSAIKLVKTKHRNKLPNEIGQIDAKSGLRVGYWKIFNEFARLIASGEYMAGKKHGTWTEIDWSRGIAFKIEYDNGVVKSRAHDFFLKDFPGSLDDLVEELNHQYRKLMRIVPTNIGEC